MESKRFPCREARVLVHSRRPDPSGAHIRDRVGRTAPPRGRGADSGTHPPDDGHIDVCATHP